MARTSRSDVTRLDIASAGPGSFRYAWSCDGQASFAGSVVAGPSDLAEHEQPVVGIALSVVLAGLFVPQVLRLRFPVPAAALSPLRRLLDCVYDVRTFCEGRSFQFPRLEVETVAETCSTPPIGAAPGAVLLLSGGADSTLSARFLKQSTAPSPLLALHTTINRDSRDGELRASREIADLLNLTYLVRPLSLDAALAQGAAFSSRFDRAPRFNAVPHARDVLLLAVAAVEAGRRGWRRLALGVEQESLHETYPMSGRMVYRQDVNSLHGRALMEELLAATYGPMSIVSPVEHLSTAEVRLELAGAAPSLFTQTYSCFYGPSPCQNCSKCLLRRLAGIAASGRRLTEAEITEIAQAHAEHHRLLGAEPATDLGRDLRLGPAAQTLLALCSSR